MSEEMDLKKALKAAKENFRSLLGGVKDTVNLIRREEPLPNPVRRRVKRRRERRKKRREQKREL